MPVYVNVSGVWKDISSDGPAPGGGDTAIFSNGLNLEYSLFSTRGHTTFFSSLPLVTDVADTSIVCACSSTTRGVFARYQSSYSLAYITFTIKNTVGNFGNLTVRRSGCVACSNNTRGIFAGGADSLSVTQSNIIDYVTIASAGNATDFGDISRGGLSEVGDAMACASTTRGVFGGGYWKINGSVTLPAASAFYTWYITIDTTATYNAFGVLMHVNADAYRVNGAASSNSTKGLFVHDDTATVIGTHITIATTASQAQYNNIAVLYTAQDCEPSTAGACSNATKGLYSYGNQYIIEYNISTDTSFSTFGQLHGSIFNTDVSEVKNSRSCSNCHGGL